MNRVGSLQNLTVGSCMKGNSSRSTNLIGYQFNGKNMLRINAHSTCSAGDCFHCMCQVEHLHFNIIIKNTPAYNAILP